jgi:hypothetical protein
VASSTETLIEELANLTEQNDSLRMSLRASQQNLAQAKLKEREVVKAVLEAAHAAAIAVYGPDPKPKKAPASRASNSGKREYVAVPMTTDWQGTKITPGYNSEIMGTRVGAFIDRVVSHTDEMRLVRPVTRCNLLIGGDMIEGLWNYPTQAWEVEVEPIAQIVIVSDLLARSIETLLENFDHVEVDAEWGNHGRVGSKRDGVPRETNLDRMVFILCRQRLAHYEAAGRLSWIISTEDVIRVEIGNYRALLMHGDEVGRNGYASPVAIRAHADRWASGSYRHDGAAYAFRDIYVGHYHQHMELPLSNGRGAIYWTGSTESENRYAMLSMAATALPTQRLHFVDPEAGWVVQQHKVYLPE